MTAALVAPVIAPRAPPARRRVVYEVRALAKVYRMGEVEVHALRSVDLDLYAGELVVLLGASGSGKSTLLNILGGLDTPALEIVVDVLSTGPVRLDVGDLAEIVEWGSDDVLLAKVTAIEPSDFTRVSALGVDEQRVNVRLTLVDRPAQLGDGYRVEARVIVWQAPNSLTVPASALFRRTEAWTVYVVGDGRARPRPVEVGHRSNAAVEIVGGLEEGSEVIIFPSDELDAGVRVKSRQAS